MKNVEMTQDGDISINVGLSQEFGSSSGSALSLRYVSLHP